MIGLGYIQSFIDPITGASRDDSDLEKIVRDALRSEYNLSSQAQIERKDVMQLENDIISRFLDRYKTNWSAYVSPEVVIADRNFHSVVQDIAPNARRLVSVQDLTVSPKPGSTKAPYLNGNQIVEIAQIAFQAYNKDQQRRAAQELMEFQRKGGRISVPAGEDWISVKTIGITIGSVVVGGALAYFAFKAMSKR